jgi:glycosyltransferase involved in cell wall biosynthesis
MDNVSFEGFTDCLGDYLAALDLFAYPSNFEGLGSVLLDAMHASLPIVASRVGGIPEIVSHGENGLLVEAGNSAALAAAILQLSEDAGLRQRLATNARQCADAYAPAEMARQYAALYTRITR